MYKSGEKHMNKVEQMQGRPLWCYINCAHCCQDANGKAGVDAVVPMQSAQKLSLPKRRNDCWLLCDFSIWLNRLNIQISWKKKSNRTYIIAIKLIGYFNESKICYGEVGALSVTLPLYTGHHSSSFHGNDHHPRGVKSSVTSWQIPYTWNVSCENHLSTGYPLLSSGRFLKISNQCSFFYFILAFNNFKSGICSVYFA